MDLQKWIEKEGGPSQVARLLGCDKGTVSQWYLLKALPKDEMKFKIHKLSKGKIAFHDMIVPFAKYHGWHLVN